MATLKYHEIEKDGFYWMKNQSVTIVEIKSITLEFGQQMMHYKKPGTMGWLPLPIDDSKFSGPIKPPRGFEKK